MFNELILRMNQFVTDRGWHKFQTPKSLCMALLVESVELLEPFIWVSDIGSRSLLENEKMKEEVQDELGDVFNTMIMLAKSLQINLLKVGSEKLLTSENKEIAALSGLETFPSISEMLHRIVLLESLSHLGGEKNPKNLTLYLISEISKLADPFVWRGEEECILLSSEMHTLVGNAFYALLLLAHELGLDPVLAGLQKVAKAEKKYPADKVRGSLEGYWQCKQEFKKETP